MEYQLNKEIETLDGTPIREFDSRMAGIIFQQCTATLNGITDDDELVEKFNTRAQKSILGEAITYRAAIRQSLMTFDESEKPSQKDQLARYDLMIKLAADTVELESAEITTIRNAVAANFKHPVIVGRVRDLLEGKSEKESASDNGVKKKD